MLGVEKELLVDLAAYDTGGFYDEVFEPSGAARPEAELLLETITSLEDGQLERCQRAAERLLVQMGVTFNVYGDATGAERRVDVVRHLSVTPDERFGSGGHALAAQTSEEILS